MNISCVEGRDNPGGRVLAGRITLAGRATFHHIDTRLTGTTFGVASVSKCLNLGFKAEIGIKEVKLKFTRQSPENFAFYAGLSLRPGCEDSPPARDSPICLGFTNGKQPKVVDKDVKMR